MGNDILSSSIFKRGSSVPKTESTGVTPRSDLMAKLKNRPPKEIPAIPSITPPVNNDFSSLLGDTSFLEAELEKISKTDYGIDPLSVEPSFKRKRGGGILSTIMTTPSGAIGTLLGRAPSLIGGMQ